MTPETRAAVRAAAAALERNGLEVASFPPQGLERARELWWNLFGRAGQVVLAPLFAGREAEMSPILKEFTAKVAEAGPLTLASFVSTLLERDQLRAEFLAQMEKFPVLLCPVCAIPAFRHGERSWNIGEHTVEYLDAMSYTQWFNLLGNPAAVVPVGKSPDGLPIGVQIVGRPWEEAIVLAIAAKIERAVGGFQAPNI